MTTLSQYLSDAGKTQRLFAEEAGVSVSFLNEIAAGRKSPSLAVAVRIIAASGGKVDLESLISTRSPSTEVEQ